MKRTKYPELKAELKQLAKEIKILKHKRDHWQEYTHEVKEPRWTQSIFMFDAFKKSREFRHKHIAYCLLRGREYEEIEQPRKDNKPDMIYVQMIKEKHEQKTESGAVQHTKFSVVKASHS